MNGSRKILAVTALAGAVLVAVGTAWACTPQPRSFAVNPDLAAPGQAAEVVGQGMPARSLVEVRWNDLQGAIIGSAFANDKGDFKASVTVPETRPGMYAVVFTADTGGVAAGRLAFAVGTPGQRTPSDTPGLWDSPVGGAASPSGSGSGFMLGAGLLGLGLVALATGAATVCVGGRRRARARTF